MPDKKSRKIPPLYWPYKSWRQAAIAYCLGGVGLGLFYLIRYLLSQ